MAGIAPLQEYTHLMSPQEKSAVQWKGAPARHQLSFHSESAASARLHFLKVIRRGTKL
jgi:hypothetical protein